MVCVVQLLHDLPFLARGVYEG